MDSLQTKIKECLPEKKETKLMPRWEWIKGYNRALLDVHSSIPKIIEIVREDEKEICICAAIQMKDGTIIRGHRHSDAMRTSEQIPKYRDEKMFSGTQGFITSKNRYVGRVEGAKLQKEAGIKSKMPEGQEYLHGELYSEDLY
jgi:hypothetical protein